MIDKELALRNVIGTMAIEGIELSADDLADCRAIIEGRVDVDEAVELALAKYLNGHDKHQSTAG